MRAFFLACTFGMCVCLFGYTEVSEIFPLKIQSHALKERKIAKIRLENGLEAYLISDPDTNQAGAALAVDVGTWDDPEDRPGMAHFVEHLLFLGTEKYPEEAGFTHYLDTHAGARNAFTASDKTVYGFAIHPSAFSEALDRFADFFIAPLFNQSGVARESKAIDEEFCKNLPDDFWRSLHVKKELAHTGHPFHHFGIGNKLTLKNIDREELIAWYRIHYGSQLMHLVVISPDSLDTLKEQVAALFSSIKPSNHIPAIHSQPLLSDKTAQKLTTITPLKQMQTLELLWELPKGEEASLLAFVLGHEGDFSLLAQLKREGLAESLGAGGYDVGREHTLFTLSIGLTTKGIAEYPKVIRQTFAAIASLQQSGIPIYLHDEVYKMRATEYVFQSRREVFSEVMDLAAQLPKEPLTSFPTKAILLPEYDAKQLESLITKLTPNACHITLLADPKKTNLACDQTEKWMQVAYGIHPLAPSLFKDPVPHQAIGLPSPNHFLPTNPTLSPLTNGDTPPFIPESICVKNDDADTFYYCSDDRFFVPKISATFHIVTPAISESNPKSKALADLYCAHINEKLTSFAYAARLAGLSYTLNPSKRGLMLKVKGYDEKSVAFMQRIFTTLNHLDLSKEAFYRHKDQVIRSYANASSASALAQGGEILWSLLYKDFAGLKEKEIALRRLKYKEFTAFCAHLFDQRHIETHLFGNLDQEKAETIASLLDKAFVGTGYPQNLHAKMAIAALPKDLQPTAIVTKCAHEGNALIVATDCGAFSYSKKAAQEILAKGLEEPFFSELRTKGQTGYIVFNEAKEMERRLYLFYVVQSSAYNTKQIQERIKTFLTGVSENLEKELISKERFLHIKAALMWQLGHMAKNYDTMNGLLNTLAFDYDADFQHPLKLIEAIDALSYEEFLEHAHRFLGGKSVSIGVEEAFDQKPKTVRATLKKMRDQLSYSRI